MLAEKLIAFATAIGLRLEMKADRSEIQRVVQVTSFDEVTEPLPAGTIVIEVPTG